MRKRDCIKVLKEVGKFFSGYLEGQNSRQRKQVHPKVEVCLVYLRNRMASVAGAERMRREEGDEIGKVSGDQML